MMAPLEPKNADEKMADDFRYENRAERLLSEPNLGKAA
jgi:hypothetical protein